MIQDKFIVNIIQDASSLIKVKDYTNPIVYLNINFDAGRDVDVLNVLSKKDESFNTEANLKYPLVALRLPIVQKYGGDFTEIRIPRIIIAHYSKEEFTPVLERFSDNEVFRNVLEPCYKELIKNICNSKWVNCSDPDIIKHNVILNPGQQPVGEGLNDYVDIIEIVNMELILNNIKNC